MSLNAMSGYKDEWKKDVIRISTLQSTKDVS